MYKDMISVTDEILFELYKIENRSLVIEILTINNELYLVNKRGVKDKFDLGLIAKIPKEMLDKHSIDEILTGCYNNDPAYQDIMSKLTFTTEEMFIMNIYLAIILIPIQELFQRYVLGILIIIVKRVLLIKI